jgi:hypothetical protein
MAMLILIFFVIVLLVIAGKRSHPAQVKGLAGILSRRCPSCRTPIHNRSTHCAHCGQETNFSKTRQPIWTS